MNEYNKFSLLNDENENKFEYNKIINIDKSSWGNIKILNIFIIYYW